MTAAGVITLLAYGNITAAKAEACMLPFSSLEDEAEARGMVDPFQAVTYLKGGCSYQVYKHSQMEDRDKHVICAVCGFVVPKTQCGKYANEYICEDCEAKSDQPGDETC